MEVGLQVKGARKNLRCAIEDDREVKKTPREEKATVL